MRAKKSAARAGDGSALFDFMTEKKTTTKRANRRNSKGEAGQAQPSAEIKTAQTQKKELRQQMESAIVERSLDLMKAVIDQAEKQGGYLPAKYLFEFAGLAEPAADEPVEEGPKSGSLIDILLNAAKDQGGGARQAEKGRIQGTP